MSKGDEYIGVTRWKESKEFVQFVMQNWVDALEDENEKEKWENWGGYQKWRYARFLTYEEFQGIFDERLGVTIQNIINNYIVQIEKLQLREDGVFHGLSQTNNKGKKNFEERLEQSIIDTFSFKEMEHYSTSNRISADLEVLKERILISFQQSLNDFLLKNPAYNLFNILGEEERIKYVKLFSKPDSYFHALLTVNPFVGNFFMNWNKFYIPDEVRKGHTYLVAGTGRGKSELLKSLIRSDALKKNTAIIVLDPNGDFAEQIALFKDEIENGIKENLVYIDPYLDNNYIPIINPFEINSDNEEYIGKVSAQIFDVFSQIFKEMGIIVSGNMETVLLNILYVLCVKKDTTLLDMLHFLDDKSNEDLVSYAKSSTNILVRNYFEKTGNKEKDENGFFGRHAKTSRFSLYPKMLRILQSDKFQKLTCGKTTIKIKEAINAKKLIVFNLSKGKMSSDTSILYGRFILNYIFNIGAERAFIPKEDRVPCHIYIDEFHDYKSDKLKETFEQGRKYGLHLTVATQVVGQNMSIGMMEAILGNTDVKIVGGAGKKTRKGMASEMDLSEVKGDLSELLGINEQTLSNLNRGEFIVKISNNLPFKMVNRTKFIDTNHNMRKELWEKVKLHQLKNYYLKIDNGEDNNSPNIQDNSPTPLQPDNDRNMKKFNSKYDL